MNKHVSLLDCTLRDGAYLLNKDFGDSVIRGIIGGLVDAGVDYIEMGFLQDDGYGEGKTVYRNAKDARKYINKNGICKYAVLADYSRYTFNNLDENIGDSFDSVRVCFFKEERFECLNAMKNVIEKGYELFIQPVDILGYSEKEVVDFIKCINKINPYCFSIVDTFGSMYEEDLERVYRLVDENLISTCKIGFHSHNNMQLSNALSQKFVKLADGNRFVVVDSTIAGMGRGAGNTPTELISQFMNKKCGYHYNIDSILNVIDYYIDDIRMKCAWGYTTPYYVAGCYDTHVNNVTYLMKKNSIRYNDIRLILQRMGEKKRKRYDFDYLEKNYIEYMQENVNDEEAIIKLKKIFDNENVLIIAPGHSVAENIDYINDFIHKTNSIVININGEIEGLNSDYLYFSNAKRYVLWKNDISKIDKQVIVTSNIERQCDKNRIVISFLRLLKPGWIHADNSVILLLRFLDLFDIKSIHIAGFDGFGKDEDYVSQKFKCSNVIEEFNELNGEIQSMLDDYFVNRNSKCDISMITPSKFNLGDQL